MLLGCDYDAKIAIGDILPSSLERICFTNDLDRLEACEWADEGYLQLIKASIERRGACESQLRCISFARRKRTRQLLPHIFDYILVSTVSLIKRDEDFE